MAAFCALLPFPTVLVIVLSVSSGPFQPTCTDCSPCSDPLLFSDDCSSNVGMSLLTSGYFYYPWDYDRSPKPDGKCSHGAEVDRSASFRFPLHVGGDRYCSCRSRSLSATGGINKSTKNCRKSPHHYLHDEAAALAVQATVHFVERLRDVAGDEQFRRFFNLQDVESLQSLSSLCFVIDKSSSMRDDIKLAKDRIQQIIQSSPPPNNYVLFHFSDYDNKPGLSATLYTCTIFTQFRVTLIVCLALLRICLSANVPPVLSGSICSSTCLFLWLLLFIIYYCSFCLPFTFLPSAYISRGTLCGDHDELCL